jgi:ABC-type cobalamin/Fe3+-siderophores transport system ATPase subunit
MIGKSPGKSEIMRHHDHQRAPVGGRAQAFHDIDLVAHDLGLAGRFADHVVVLSQGRLVAQGGAAEALSERVMADVFRISAYRAEYQREAVIVPWAEI